ncbi:hypothetical protein ABIE50_004336 [Chitinophaga sp. OAE865]
MFIPIPKIIKAIPGRGKAGVDAELQLSPPQYKKDLHSLS